MSKYQHVLRAFAQTPWAIREQKLAEIRAFLARVVAQPQAAGMPQYPVAAMPKPIRVGSVEIIPVQGVISQKMNMLQEFSGGTSTELLTQQVQRAVDDATVSAILLDIDSPGGSVFGVAELGDYLRQARESKRIVAVANACAASAAYWIAAQASELVVTPSGMVGSIGVFSAHEDMTEAQKMDGVKTTIIRAGKYKAEVNPYEPLSEDALANIQKEVNAYYDMFVRAVAAGRNESLTKVRDGYGQGRMLLAADAKAAGMVDRVATLDATLGRLLTRAARPAGGGQAFATVREFEAFLRDEGGCSHAEAKRIASLTYKDGPAPREAAAVEPQPEGADAEKLKLLQQFVADINA